MAIQFLNNVNADNGVLYVDAVNDKVGIGTTSPGSTLEVNGGELDVSGGDGYRIETKPFANWASDLLTLGDWDGEGYATRIMGSNSSEVMRVTGANVGIGTTSPGAKLHVDASGIGVKIHSAQSIGLEVSGGANGLDIARFQNVSGSTKVTINNNGLVGIGATSLTDKLTVENGNIRLNSTASYPSQGLMAYWNNGSPGMGGISWRNDPGFIGSEWYHYKSTSPYTQARIRLIGDASGQMNVNLNNSQVFTILASNGNVGIGATNPAEKLHVYNGTAYVTPITYAASQSAYALKIGAYNSTLFDMGLQAKSTSGGSPYMSFRTTSVDDALTIWQGSVGVGGIGIPSYTLDVDGQIRGEQYLRLKDTAGTNQLSIRAESTYGTLDNGSKTFNYIASNHLFLVGASEKMRINSSGNVGIGITSPGAKLDILNTGGSAASLADCQTYSALTVKPYSSVDSKLTFSADSGNTQIIQATNNASTNGRQIALQPFSGNVGIGTTTPSQKLEVSGAVVASSTMTASNFILSSDEKLKENIKDLNQKPLNVKWRKFELKSEPGVHRVGVIAQELEKTNPEFIREDKDGLKSVAYIDLLITKIAELEARLEKAGL